MSVQVSGEEEEIRWFEMGLLYGHCGNEMEKKVWKKEKSEEWSGVRVSEVGLTFAWSSGTMPILRVGVFCRSPYCQCSIQRCSIVLTRFQHRY